RELDVQNEGMPVRVGVEHLRADRLAVKKKPELIRASRRRWLEPECVQKPPVLFLIPEELNARSRHGIDVLHVHEEDVLLSLEDGVELFVPVFGLPEASASC